MSDRPAPECACTDLFQGLELATLSQCSKGLNEETSAPLRFEIRTLGRLRIAEARTPPLRLQVADQREQPTVIVWLQLDGQCQLSQRDQTLDITTGHLCLLRSARPLAVTLAPARVALVALPESEIADRFPLWRAALLRPIALQAGMPAFFLDAISSLLRWQESIGEPIGDQVADAMLDLIGAVICCAVPDTSGCLERSLHRRQQVKRYIQRHLQEPDLSAETIARAIKLSVRQVHRLFAEESQSLMRWIWTRRLEACHQDLQRDPLGRRSLAEIAYAWGFNDQAHFSRAFRRQFGVSPSKLRQQLQARTSDALSSHG